MLTGPGRVARAKVLVAFQKYFKSDPQDAALVIWDRQRAQREAGMTEEEIIKQDITFPIAIFPNTIPAFYWTAWELGSRPDILSEVREEVENQAVSGSRNDGFVLDVAALKTRCPLLLSVFEETQRTRHVHANIRAVISDTVVGDKYLLKAGNYLQMPGNPIHTSNEVWGSSASKFDPYRFVPKRGIDRDAIPASGFLAWGAPPHLCPARQFATTEILIAVAMLVVRADLRPLNGVWEKNPALKYGELTTIVNPKKDKEVVVSVRERWTGKWSLKMSESRNRISLASG